MDATLAQGNQVINLILQKRVSDSQLQELFESGLLADLLGAYLEGVDRNAVRIALGYKAWGVVYIEERPRFGRPEGQDYRVNNMCTSKTDACFTLADFQAVVTTTDGKETIRVRCCRSARCIDTARWRANRYFAEFKNQKNTGVGRSKD